MKISISTFILIVVIGFIWLYQFDEITEDEIEIGKEKCACHKGVQKMYSDLTTTRVECNDGETFIANYEYNK
jgi:hypothetical protein